MLKVVVECAKSIPKKTIGIPDPIATVIFKGEKKKTKAITSELNPVWNEILEFDLKGSPLDASSFIDVVVKDYETIGKDKLIGSTKISLRDLASGQIKSLPSRNVPLVSEKKQDTGATISLLIGYEPPGSSVPNPNAQVDGDTSTGEAGVSPAGKEEGDEETTDWGDPRAPGEAPVPGQPGKTPQKMMRRKRPKSLSNKPQDFQIRVRVIEGRQLPGNNIKPVVKIFFYNMNMLPSELFDENIYIRVFNSSSLRSDSLLGEFKLDVGYVYDEPAHAIMKKWLLLSDPDDSSSGARGYLKVNMIIVGTGDEPPTENKESNEECDDIESNLLLSAGVTLRSAILSLKVYRAEDMPQMDDAFAQTVKNIFGGEGDKKNLVDPFLEVGFAGKKICTKIIEKNANPEWNQVIHLQVKFPSMCERIRLTMFDWDRFTSNDTVGTTYLNLSKISSSGGDVEDRTATEVGFLPAFGPCYLNFYGSTREFSDLPDPYEELNLGQGEGVAYRGRVLIELSTQLNDKLDKKVDDISSDDILVVQQANITTLKTAILAKITETRLAEIWLKLISQLIEDLTNYCLPDVEAKPNLTALDVQLKKLRDKSIINIREAACRMREEATDVKATMTDIDDWLERLQQIAEEPQNSMPDIIIWMLRGEKRMAYARIPVNEVLFSTHSEEASGKFCGKTQTIFMKYPMDKNKGVKFPVQLRLNMWLGLSAHEKKFNSFAEGTFSVNAEMYENQAQVFGKWGTTGLVGRHKFSDVTGKVKLKQEYFLPPRGWEWEGDWYVDPENCLLTEADAGHTEFTDEVYENESRFPGGEWKPATEHYTDVNGEKAQTPSEIECPPAWRVIQEWGFDSNRAVDEKGWEYGITIPPDDKPSSWVAAEKMYHVHRRKRLVRLRKKTANTPNVEKKEAGDGWEYSSLIGWKFHRKERSSDTFRRRRWRRKMAPSDRVGASAIFQLEGALGVDIDEKTSKKEAAVLFGANTPTVSCIFSKSYMYHLRVYVYQARNLLPMDKDSFSDPYCHVSFLHVSKTTEIIKANLNPTWDQTLIFNDIEIYGDPKTIAQNPPSIVLELFDSDQVGKDEPMGRCTCPPVVKLNPGTPVSPKLLWFPVTMKGRNAGEMLVAAELLLKDKGTESELPLVPPRRGETLYMVPQGIRPVVQLTAIELLPKEEMYTPPIVLKVIDHRPFGRKPIVGQCTINSLEEYRCDPYMDTSEVSRNARVVMMAATARDVIINMEGNIPVIESQIDEAVDWWSKFYASTGEREKCGPYLQKGYSMLTGSFRLYPLSDDPDVKGPPRQFRELPESGPQECLVRIYVLRCIDLQPKDNNGLCDPYLKIHLGKKTLDDRDNYKPNTLNPEFGRMFEMSCFLPQEKDLKISVYDFDLLSRDEKVGDTIIDLENRLLSRFNAHCGLSQSYCVSGVNQWRDQLKPSQILENLARLKGLPPPQIAEDGSLLSFGGRDYSLQELEASTVLHQHLGPAKERICLHALRNQGLTPEHVETRTLYSSFQPTLAQMWVDIFPKSLGIPGPPVDITPRKAKKHYLRAIIWNTTDVILDETSITGEKMSDIYVKGWMPGMEEDKQKTDVHYRSLDGDGNFNWRFVFGFDYLPAEQLCLVSKKGKVEMTLEIVDEREVDERPAGKGRDEPNMNPKLDPPNRPDTSFLWFTNPCKTMKFIVWRRYKWIFIGLILLLLVLLFVGILLYSLPNYISMKIVKPF
ncbi:Myoferlin [Bagarius yarrelli]|uniref:Myoferlin n=1 Tax=Bagarius yarrelli TaxID=175774 RepID=A0A556TMZ0_BAGYA|nr:Myoferlin [Bagarius yarrelli]